MTFFTHDDVDTPMLETLKSVVRQHHDDHPRSQQVELGPSQIGHPCPRNLLSHMTVDPINPPYDPLPSYLGVAAHRHVEEAINLDNSKLITAGRKPRWIAEKRLDIGMGVAGTCDLYDTEQNWVIDLKFPGATAFTKYRKDGPSETYRTQVHLYAYGYSREGFPVDRVAIWFLPRGGVLANSYLWSEPYDETVAAQALSRYESLMILADELALGDNPERLGLAPTEPGGHCAFCPWYTKPDETQGNPAACTADGWTPRGKRK